MMIFSGLYLLRHSTTLSTLSIRLNSVFSDIILSQLVQKIVLFGSLAEGKAIPGSDVDLLIVLEDKRRIFERISEFLRYFSDLGTAIDVSVQSLMHFLIQMMTERSHRRVCLKERKGPL